MCLVEVQVCEPADGHQVVGQVRLALLVAELAALAAAGEELGLRRTLHGRARLVHFASLSSFNAHHAVRCCYINLGMTIVSQLSLRIIPVQLSASPKIRVCLIGS